MPPEHPSQAWLQGDSLMTQQILAYDWAATPLGPLAHWPQSLRTLVRLLLKSSQPMHLAWGPELVSIYNDGYIPILGDKHPQGLGLPFRALWSEVLADAEPMLAAIWRCESQYFEDMPVALAGRAGRPMSWFTFSWTPLHDESGQVQGFFCAATETTERVLESAQLARVMQLMDEMERSTHSGSWELDLSKGEMVCSAGMLRLHGLDPAGPTPRLVQWLELLHPEETDLKDPTCRHPTDPNERVKEYRIVTPQGETRWMGSVVSYVQDEQRPRSVVRGITFDLTRNKALEQDKLSLARLIHENRNLAKTLRARQEQLDLTLEAADLSLWEFDPVAKTFTADSRLWLMLGDGTAPYQPTLQTWQARLHPDDLAPTLKAFNDHLEGHTESYTAEYRMRHRQGHWVWVQANGKVLARDPQGQALRAAGTMQDISTRKRQSEQGMELLQQIKSLIRDMGNSPAQSAPSTWGRTSAGNASELDQLTRRQRQLLELIARGWTSAQIAAELHISTATAVSHRRDLMRKLKLHNAADVTRFAIRHGLVRGE